MEIIITPRFRKLFKKLPQELQEEAKEKIRLFQDRSSHEQLKVHKLKGRLAGQYSFSVNYSYRIVFVFEKHEDAAVLYAIGDHDVYK